MEMKNPHTIWAAVVVVGLLILSAMILALNDKDVSIILTLAGLVAVPVLGAFGAAVYQKLDQVREASNGSMSRLMEMHHETQQQLHSLALSTQPPTPLSSPGKEGETLEGLRNTG